MSTLMTGSPHASGTDLDERDPLVRLGRLFEGDDYDVRPLSPARTRRRLAEAFAAAPSGRGQHGNIPL